MSFALLFQPLTLPRSGLELKNRLVMAPMPTFAADPDGAISDAELAYYRRRAAGGLAAIITAGCAVSADGISFDGQCRCDSNTLLPALSRAAQTIRDAGARAVLQLCHGGVPVLSEADPERLVAAFTAGAHRARQAGFDAVEIHGGHRYLVQQFFSPATNPGKSFDERVQFPLAVARAAAEAWGGPLWMRLDPEEKRPDGYGFDELRRLAERLAEAGVELFDVSASNYFAGSIRNPGDPLPRAQQLERKLGLPTMAVGGIATPAEALAARSDGCSLVGLGRVLLGEPEWAQRVLSGDADAIATDLDSDARLENADVPAPVLDYLARKPRERRIRP
ncbi:MAG: hypothetical protein R2748_29975 [Bryobacterales bacterium]